MEVRLFVVCVVVCLVSMVTGRRIYDLTHTLDKDAPKWPLAELIGDSNASTLNFFNSRPLFGAYISQDIWVALRAVEFYEHMGTHIDAPTHFGRGRQAAHEIPASRLIGPGVVIDVTEKASANPIYGVTVQDIRDHESEYGEIEPGSVVLMNSGWGKKYPDPKSMFGTETPDNSSTFRFPGFSPEACDMLLNERAVNVVGVDTPSVDIPIPPTYGCHVNLQTNNVVLLEYAANLDSIPIRGTTIVVGAPKFRDSTGGPSRLLAFVDDDDDKDGVSAATSPLHSIAVMAFSSLLVLFS